MSTAEVPSCSICQSEDENALGHCIACEELICHDCPASACSCPGAFGLHSVLKSEIRTEGLKAGLLMAASRKRLLSALETRQMRMHMERAANLTEEFIPLDDELMSQAA